MKKNSEKDYSRCKTDACKIRDAILAALVFISIYHKNGLPFLFSKLREVNSNGRGEYLPLRYVHGDAILSAGESKKFGPTTLKLTEEGGLELKKGNRVIWSPELKLRCVRSKITKG